MSPERTGSPRGRYHGHVRNEIETVAWEQVSGAGISALSIKAIAAHMGVSAAALYRYIGGRDELLDTLAVRAATELVEALDHLVLSVPDCAERVVAIADCIRRWAKDYPGRFELVFRSRDGRPHVPTGVVAAELMALEMITSACEAVADSAPAASGRPRPRPGRLRNPDPAAPTGTSHRALSIWTRVLGTVEMELTGHLARLGVEVDDWFDREIRLAVGVTAGEARKRVLTSR